MGNESGYGPNTEAELAYIKSVDSTRLTHYESQHYILEGYPADFSNLDIDSNMYPTIESIQERFREWNAKDKGDRKPYVLCEFSTHGQRPGDLEDYMELIQAHDGFVGAFVWEWCDHALYMGRDANGREQYYYGGDFGEFPTTAISAWTAWSIPIAGCIPACWSIKTCCGPPGSGKQRRAAMPWKIAWTSPI